MVVKLYYQASAYLARTCGSLFNHIDGAPFAVKRCEIARRVLLYLASRLFGKLHLKGDKVALGISAMHDVPYFAPVD